MHSIERAIPTWRSICVIADTHWSRFCGLMGTDAASFPAGEGLWIVPCHGVHTFAMRFPIDVLYLDSDKDRRPPRRESETLADGPGSLRATSVLELPGSTWASTQTAIGDEIEIALEEAASA